jgi:hypothetical protein
VYSDFGIVTSKLATPWKTSPSTTTGDALICANGCSLVTTCHWTAPLVRSSRYKVAPLETYTASPTIAGAPTMKPPIFVCQTSVPVLASTAQTVPVQSPK